MHSHTTRFVFWAQQESVSHFTAHSLEQLRYEPLSGFEMLQSYILADNNDRFVNGIQWLSFLGCIFGVALIAKHLGAGFRGQIGAVVICATIPMAIMQSTSTQVDLVASFWLVITIYCLLSLKKHFSLLNVILLGCSLGLALLSKTTNYFFFLPFLVWLFISFWFNKFNQKEVNREAGINVARTSSSAILSIPDEDKNNREAGATRNAKNNRESGINVARTSSSAILSIPDEDKNNREAGATRNVNKNQEPIRFYGVRNLLAFFLILFIAFIINAPHYYRNMKAFKHPLGLYKGKRNLVSRISHADFTKAIPFEIIIPEKGVYNLLAKYYSSSSKPFSVFIDRKLQLTDVGKESTKSNKEKSAKWFFLGRVNLIKGKQTIQLYRKKRGMPKVMEIAVESVPTPVE